MSSWFDAEDHADRALDACREGWTKAAATEIALGLWWLSQLTAGLEDYCIRTQRRPPEVADEAVTWSEALEWFLEAATILKLDEIPGLAELAVVGNPRTTTEYWAERGPFGEEVGDDA